MTLVVAVVSRDSAIVFLSLSASWLVPVAIGAGMAVLLAAMVWQLPAISGMALVALGAAAATIERFRDGPMLRPVLFSHAAIYGALYALFVAATFHRPAVDVELSMAAMADLLASLAIMSVTACLIASACRCPAGSER